MKIIDMSMMEKDANEICMFGKAKNIKDIYEKIKSVGETRTRVCKCLLNLGCPVNYYGYNYLRDGICKGLEQPNFMGCLRKTIYSLLAEQHDTSADNVERCIRTITEKWWTANQCGAQFSRKPTNSQILSTLTERIRIESGF